MPNVKTHPRLYLFSGAFITGRGMKHAHRAKRLYPAKDISVSLSPFIYAPHLNRRFHD